MRQGLVRVLALGALVVVGLAPVATAGAAGDGTAGAPAATTAARRPARPLRWSDVAGRLREQRVIGRDTAADGSPGRAAVRTAPLVPIALVAAPALTVTPSTGLVSGAPVTVTGSGFPAHQFLLTECAAGGSTPDQCGLDVLTPVQPDGTGAFSTSFTVSRTLRLYPGTHVDCATSAGACELVAIDINSATGFVSAAVPLTFDPNAPLPHPSIVVTPATGLLDGQQVSVAGTGFSPGSFVSVAQCSVGGFSCSGSPAVGVGADGKFTLSVQLSLRINDGLGGLTTCLAVACVIDAESYDAPDYYASVPLAFDPSQPIPPPPTITVTPHTGLHHDQQVQIHGTGYVPGSEVEISECAPDAFGSCADFLDYRNADGSGAFDATVAVTRLVTSYGPLDETSTLDCATASCSISAASYDSQVSLVATAALSFDGSVPPPPVPVVTATPDSDLPFRASVAVHGSGYAPGEQVIADFCMQDQGSGLCGLSSGPGYTNVGPDGTFDVTVAVQRRISFGSGEGLPTIDCVSPTARCTIDVQADRGYQHVSVPLTFDPNAPIPPPPSASISPDQNLGYRQAVTVTGTNFPPGPVQVEQCAQLDATQPFSVCGGYAQLTADSGGHVSGTVVVTRVLRFGSASVDCATTTCVLQLGNYGPDDSATVALRFDPSSQPPPPPALTVTPHAGLIDGQHVTVAGASFTPGSLVGVTECRAGATVIADGCDIGQVRIATVGADGTFSRRFVTESVLATADGPLDCTRAPGCVLAAANAPANPDFAAAPLTFVPPELAVTGVGVTEGTGGMTMAPVRVTLSQPDRNPLTIRWVAESGTATQGTDFTSMRGTVTIPAGRTEAMIDTTVVADAMDEPTETYRVRVVEALGTKVVDPSGVVTIHDDDAPPAVTVHDTSRREDHGEAHAEVTLSAPSGRTVIVHYVTHHGTARAGSDYVRKDSRLIFLPGETRHLVRVVLVNDHVHEPTETFRVEIDRVEQATGARSAATVTITDDD